MCPIKMLKNAVLACDETLDNFFLVDVFEDVWRVDENAQRSADGHGKEHSRRTTTNTDL